MTSPAWDPSMPLRWDASDEEIRTRQGWLLGYVRGADGAYRFASAGKGRAEGINECARELAAASVAHALHERDGGAVTEEMVERALDDSHVIDRLSALRGHGGNAERDLRELVGFILAAGFRRMKEN